MKLCGLVVGVLLAGSSLAAAEQPQVDSLERSLISAAGEAPLYGFVAETRPDGLVLARQVLPEATDAIVSGTTSDGVALVAQSRIVFLNKNGVTLSPGDNDSRTNKSTIVTATTSFPAWNVSATTWNETVSCMRDLFARFDVQIVETDPGNVPHIEAVFGGSPTQVGMDTTVAGVSPFTLDCRIIENSVVFTFVGAFQFSSREACEIMAQEVAHSYGLDHELLASDPMTYLTYTGNRSFQDQAVSCGESATRACGINGSVCRPSQNSVALLTERLGIADAIMPTMAWTSPANNATVPPGFEVRASGTDNLAVKGATLKIDGVQVDTETGAGPFVLTASTTLADGPHTVIVEVTDGKNIKSETRTLTVKKGAAPPPGAGGEGGLDDGDVVGGCTAGGAAPGFVLVVFALFSLRRRRRPGAA